MKVPTLLGLFAVLVLSGCASLFGPAATRTPPLQIKQPQEPQEARPGNRWLGTQFEDVPVPTDFTLDYDASYVSISAQQPRVADLRYTGDTPLTDVLSYVQQSMSRLGWQLTSLAGVAIKRVRYVKGDEECQLLIRGGDQGESVLVVRLHPR